MLEHEQDRETGRGFDNDSATAVVAVAGSAQESRKQLLVRYVVGTEAG